MSQRVTCALRGSEGMGGWHAEPRRRAVGSRAVRKATFVFGKASGGEGVSHVAIWGLRR